METAEFGKYILIYLAFGLPVAIITRIALTENTIGGWVFVLFVWPLWPVWSLVAVWSSIAKISVWYSNRSCIYCGLEMNKDPALWRIHSPVCPKHPLGIENRRLRAKLEEISNYKDAHEDLWAGPGMVEDITTIAAQALREVK